MDYSLGIDLGTTYSAAATARGDRLEIFQLGERAATIPSVIVLRADGEVLVGDAAERRALSEPVRTAREFKRRLGDPTPIILGGTPYGAEALIGHLLRSIAARVAEQMGGQPAAIAVCHPASYGDYKIDLLRQAVRQADIGPVELITEPQAAALHYALQERVPTGEVIAVYDFGGGTFDATILRKTQDGFEQLGRPEGMERLGGIDFDEAIFAHVMTTVRSAGVQVDPNDPATLAGVARLREECRRAKEGLSTDTDATIAVSLPGIQTDVRLTREEFESMIRPRIRETILALDRAARSAGLGFGGIDRILLVGGSSRIPLVAEMVREATERPIALDAHPKHTMALGAAWVAERSRLAAAGETPTEPVPASDTGGVAAAGALAGAAGVAAAGMAAAEPSAKAGIGAATTLEPRPASASLPAAATEPAPRPRAATTSAPTGRPPRMAVAAVAALVLIVLVAAGAFAFLSRGGGSATGSPGPSASEIAAASSPAESPSLPPASPTPSVASIAPPSPSPTPVPTPTPTPSGQQARILSIKVSGGRYVVDYQVFGYKQVLPGKHVHFYFDTVPSSKAGKPGTGPWFVYAGPIPFKGYKVSDKPAKATQMCILFANPDHSVVQDTGNCVDLPQ
ncbi:MAG: Hsp70 family protein [Candidatus Limnocylindrales bacterium]